MTSFQECAIAFIALWILIVVIRFRRSTAVLIGGLFVVGMYTCVGLLTHRVSTQALGLGMPIPWLSTLGFTAVWLALMFAYSPVADRIATWLIAKPPTLGAFRALQESSSKLLIGIVVAWVLGGFLEELVFRGIVLRSIEALASGWLARPSAAGVAVCAAAAGAGLIHLYQGPRAVIIVTQLSVLFGVLFVLSGYNLWTVMLCHGLYDTIAFIRFANKQSRYSQFAGEPSSAPS